MNAWKDPEALRILRVTAATGAYVREIVAALQAKGFAVNRNAVIGKAHRTGIALKRPPGRNFDPERTASARRQAFPSPAAVPPPAAPEDGPRPPCLLSGEVAAVTISAEAPALPPQAGGVPLIGLPWDRCRWPVAGDGAGLLVCGAQAEHRAYCRAHGRLAYQPLGTPLRLPAGASAPRGRSEERETDLVDVLGEAV